MARAVVWLLAAIMLVGASPAWAADTGRTEYVPGPPITNGTSPNGAQGPITGPLRPPPGIRYGCQRVWRCDKTVCEWRRGCWGVYGYVEGPYYTSEFARRQWESHGLPTLLQRRAMPNR
jgi:hypothetical protein